MKVKFLLVKTKFQECKYITKHFSVNFRWKLLCCQFLSQEQFNLKIAKYLTFDLINNRDKLLCFIKIWLIETCVQIFLKLKYLVILFILTYIYKYWITCIFSCYMKLFAVKKKFFPTILSLVHAYRLRFSRKDFFHQSYPYYRYNIIR